MTPSPGDSTLGAGVMSAEQKERLLSVHVDLDLHSAERDLLSQFADRLRTILSASVIVLSASVIVMGKRDRRWTIVAKSPSESLLEATTDFEAAIDQLKPGTPTVLVESSGKGDALWTLVACATRPPSIIAIHGDWTPSLPAFVALSRNVTRVWQARAQAGHARSGVIAHRLARRLLRARGIREVYEAIVHRMPAAVHARIAALAVPDPTDGRLTIVATHCYPRELVEHLRIEPHSGVFGSVFQSGRVLLVKGFDQSSTSRRRRPRYRTDSYIAMPLTGASEVLGVICVTDRRDDEPFTMGDVSILRAMAAPAALALGRERAIVQAENFALTAAIDPLSGAFNRRHFHMRLEEELQRSVRYSLSLAFLMIDIDDFKAVNDSFGHLAGDVVIRDVAEILRRSVRVFDICARFGGDEFAVIIPGSVVESATIVAERIRERVESYRPSDQGLEKISLTVSIGLAESTAGMSAHDLIESADRALYLAKRAGQNRVRLATSEDSRERTPLPAELRHSEPDEQGL